MNRQVWIGVFLIAFIAGGRALGGEPRCSEPIPDSILQRWHSVGGWNPYGGGFLHWWNPACFPHCGGPDDYCRKPLPRVCWPPYPSYYIWGPPEICSPQCQGCPPCKPSH